MPKDLVHHGGWRHGDLHNLYGAYMQMGTYQGLLARGKERPFVLSRSFFSGSQKYGAIWTGDNKSNWDYLKITAPMLLSLGISGMTFSGADVGGFFGNPEIELLMRWYQAGAFQPFFRAHAHIEAKRREPYLTEEPYRSFIFKAIGERYKFLPYFYTLFYEASLDGSPVLRPLFWEFPKETSLYDIDSQYMIGKYLLCKPICESSISKMDVVLPVSTSWYDYFSGKLMIRRRDIQFSGLHFFNFFSKILYSESKNENSVEIPVSLSTIPLFQRGGSIIPLKTRRRRSSAAMKNDPFTLKIALDEKVFIIFFLHYMYIFTLIFFFALESC